MRGKQECASHHIADVEGVFVLHLCAHSDRLTHALATRGPTRSMQCSANAGLEILGECFCSIPMAATESHLFEYEVGGGLRVFWIKKIGIALAHARSKDCHYRVRVRDKCGD